MTAEKKVMYGCWNNDPQRINEDGQCGLLRQRVFETEQAARDHYWPPRNCDKGDVLVRITVEALKDA